MLSKTNRIAYFKALELGEYNKTNIKKLQMMHFQNAKDIDGEYGTNTDKLLVNLYRVKKYAPHFKITEFRCHCKSKYCTGYPAKLNVNLLKNLEFVRAEFSAPVTITSGLRCKKWNAFQAGSATQSRHISGKAADITGSFTGTSAKRAKVKAVWYDLPKANYCYYGTANMGTSVHVDVK